MNTYIIAYLVGYTRHYIQIDADSAREAVCIFRQDYGVPIVFVLVPVEEEWA